MYLLKISGIAPNTLEGGKKSNHKIKLNKITNYQKNNS